MPNPVVIVKRAMIRFRIRNYGKTKLIQMLRKSDNGAQDLEDKKLVVNRLAREIKTIDELMDIVRDRRSEYPRYIRKIVGLEIINILRQSGGYDIFPGGLRSYTNIKDGRISYVQKIKKLFPELESYIENAVNNFLPHEINALREKEME